MSARLLKVGRTGVGNDGEWKFVARESSEDTFVFVRGAAAPATAGCKKAAAEPGAAKKAKPTSQKRKVAPASEPETALPATTRQTRSAK